MVEEPTKIVAGLMVFILLAIGMFFTFASPECQTLANSTVFALRGGINEVARGEFPEWKGDGEPANSQYFEKVPVRLCQESGTNYWQQFWGGAIPRYQIYYERWPEGFFTGGAGMWEESYPWSGGSGSQFFMWGALRAGKGLGKVGKYLSVGKVLAPAKISLSLKQGMEAFTRWNRARMLIRLAQDPAALQKTIIKDAEIAAAKKTTGELYVNYVYRRALAEEDFNAALKDLGWVAQDVEIKAVDTTLDKAPLNLVDEESSMLFLKNAIKTGIDEVPATKVLPDSLKDEVAEEIAREFVKKNPDMFFEQAIKQGVDRGITNAAESGGIYRIPNNIDRIVAGDIVAGRSKLEVQSTVFSKLTKEGKIPLLDKDVPMKFLDEAVDPPKTYYIYVKEKAGKIEEIMTGDTPTPSKAGFKVLAMNPARDMDTFLKEMAPPEQARILRAVLETDPAKMGLDDIEFFDEVARSKGWGEAFEKFSVKKTPYYKHWYEPLFRKIKKLFGTWERLGYKMQEETILPEEALGIVKAIRMRPPEEIDRLLSLHPVLKRTVAKQLRISESAVGYKALDRYLMNVEKSITGPAFMHGGSKMTAYKAAKDIYEANREVWSRTTAMEQTSDIVREMEKRGMFNPKKYPAIADLAKNNPEELRRIAGLTVGSYHPNGAVWSEKIYTDYMKEYAFKMQDVVDPKTGKVIGQAPLELFSFMGFAEQNTAPLPIDWKWQGLKLQTRKMIFVQGGALVNPSGWWWKGEAMQAATEQTCTDNALCLYTEGALFEVPFELSEDAKDYFVHSWRPINPGYRSPIQPLLMSIPEHPRFHVVGPCLGLAKIWKQDKEIYVSMEKCRTPNSANYCYADKDLTDTLVGIWLASDAATIVETIVTFGASAAAKTASTAGKAIVGAGAKNTARGMAKKVIAFTDPVTAAQAFAEAAIAWPKGVSESWGELTYGKMKEAGAECMVGVS